MSVLAQGTGSGQASGRIRATKPIHPVFVRVSHWINAGAMIVMIGSGWEIHNAHPILPVGFPARMTLGEGLAEALRWHFAAMWVLAINGTLYVAYGIASGRLRRKLLPITPAEVLADVRAALGGRLAHADLSTYNAVQKLLYAGVIGAGMLAVVSGLAIWKPVQFAPLTQALGDFGMARIVHFAAMTAIVLFLVVHVAMALLVPASLRAMLRGH
ncbi:MAG: cytochrome b/b6 domain-containing protein [Alsobacter sp.]